MRSIVGNRWTYLRALLAVPGLDVPVLLLQMLLIGNAQGIAWQVPSHWEGMKGQKLWDGKQMSRLNERLGPGDLIQRETMESVLP